MRSYHICLIGADECSSAIPFVVELETDADAMMQTMEMPSVPVLRSGDVDGSSVVYRFTERSKPEIEPSI